MRERNRHLPYERSSSCSLSQFIWKPSTTRDFVWNFLRFSFSTIGILRKILKKNREESKRASTIEISPRQVNEIVLENAIVLAITVHNKRVRKRRDKRKEKLEEDGTEWNETDRNRMK